jgi:hypothetical protein
MIKKTALKTGYFVFLAVLLLLGSHAQIFAQGLEPVYDDQYYANPDLSREQSEKIRELEERLDKELSPLHQRLRSLYRDVDRLETAANPEPRKIDEKWAEIDRLENDIRDREMKHEQRIAEIVPQAVGSYGYPGGAYAAQGYWGRMGRGPGGGGMGRMSGAAGYGGGGYGIGRGRSGYVGRGYGRAGAGAGYGGYGRIGVGYGMGTRGYTGGVRLGRGPCGAGLGRLSGAGYGGYGRVGTGYGYGGYGIGRGRSGYADRGYGRAGAGAAYGGYGRIGAGYGMGTRGYSGRSITGGVRMGPGPCGLGIGRLTAPRFSRRGRWYR